MQKEIGDETEFTNRAKWLYEHRALCGIWYKFLNDINVQIEARRNKYETDRNKGEAYGLWRRYDY